MKKEVTLLRIKARNTVITNKPVNFILLTKKITVFYINAECVDHSIVFSSD